MSEDFSQPTQMMPTVPPTPGAGATQMGGSVFCSVCGTSNSTLETYCSECGFLLSSAPGTADPEPVEDTGLPELVESKSGRRFKLKTGPNTVGRENCDILLMDGTVSRRHAQVVVEDGAVTVTDGGSTNGTQVDGEKLAPNAPRTVAPGTVLVFGSATLTLVESGATPAPVEATIVTPTGEPMATDQTLIGVRPVASTAPSASVVEETPAPEDAIAKLLPTSGVSASIYIVEGTLTVGRRPGNDVVLPGDPYVSGRHAEFVCDNSGCYLTDLGSTNGTTVNGQKLEANVKQLLLDGDEVQIGRGVYKFGLIGPDIETASSETAHGEETADDLAELSPTTDPDLEEIKKELEKQRKELG